MATTVAVYTRISRDLTGVQTATSRQERACRAYTEARGWTVLNVWEDVDLSAYQPKVRRPAFEDLVRQLRTGAFDGVLVWKLDRLVRRSSEFERFWHECETAGCFLASVTEPVDTSTEMGVAIVRILVTFANMESTTKGVRLKAKHRELAEQGRSPGRPAFGHTAARIVVPEEATLLQEAANRVIAGDSLRSIAEDWNSRGVPTPTGRNWGGPALGKILISPRLAGHRSLGDEIVARDCWEPILDAGTWAECCAVLAGGAAQRTARSGPALLTGLIRCARCGAWMSRCQHNKQPGYRCPGGASHCGGTAIPAEPIERWVLVMIRWRRTRPLRPHAPPEPDEAAARALEQCADSLRKLTRDYYVTSTLTRDEFLTARNALWDQRSALRAARRPPRQPLRPFNDMPMGELRALVQSELIALAVHPVAARGRREGRIDARWRDEVNVGAGPPGFIWGDPPPRRKPPDTTHEWLTATDAARYLGYETRRPVDLLIKNHTIPYTNTNTGTWLTKPDLDRYIDSCQIQPSQPRR